MAATKTKEHGGEEAAKDSRNRDKKEAAKLAATWMGRNTDGGNIST